MAELDTVVVASVDQCLGDQLRSIVDADDLGQSAPGLQPFKGSHDAAARNRGVDDNIEHLPDTIVEDVQRSKATAAVEGVAHEVERPDAIGFRGRLQWMHGANRYSFLLAAWQVQSHGLVHAMDALMVPPMAVQPEPVKTQPGTPARVVLYQIVQCINHRLVILATWRRVIGRA